MIRRKGIAGFVGNSLHWIKGVFSPSYSVNSADVVLEKIGIGVWSRIDTRGQSALSTITSSGVGVLSTITPSQGMYSFIDSRGQSTASEIDENGQGVNSQ